MDIRIFPPMATRPCNFCLSLQGGSVFADFKIKGLDENSAVGTLTAEEIAAARTMGDITGANYGPLKALCEQEAEKAFPGNACNIRPGFR